MTIISRNKNIVSSSLFVIEDLSRSSNSSSNLSKIETTGSKWYENSQMKTYGDARLLISKKKPKHNFSMKKATIIFVF